MDILERIDLLLEGHRLIHISKQWDYDKKSPIETRKKILNNATQNISSFVKLIKSIDGVQTVKVHTDDTHGNRDILTNPSGELLTQIIVRATKVAVEDEVRKIAKRMKFFIRPKEGYPGDETF